MAKAKKLVNPKTKTKLGKVHLFVTKEAWDDDADIPRYSVEKGKDVSDHVQDKPNILVLTGFIFSDKSQTVSEKIKKLRAYKNKGVLLTFVGRRTGTNFLINRFHYDSENTTSNGHPFTMTLQEVRIATKKGKPKKKSAKNKVVSGRKQTNGNKKTAYHIVKKGDCYWDLARKYGTTWQQLYKWNKYPPRRIPIGVKLKVR